MQWMNFYQGKNSMKNYENLNSTDKNILQYLIKNKHKLNSITLQEIAKKLFISKTTIINLAKKLGYKGYSELRYHLTQNKKQEEDVKLDRNIKNEIEEEVKKTLILQNDELLETVSRKILSSKLVYVFGRGSSSYFGEYLASRLSILNIKSIFISDINILEVMLDHLCKDDMIIFLSQSGETEIVVSSAIKVYLKGHYTLSITAFLNSRLSNYSTTTLYYHSNKINTKKVDTYSRLGMITIVQMLIEYISKLKKEIH